MKKALIKLGLSIAAGIGVAGITAIIQAIIVKWEVVSVTKFVSNCTFFSTVMYLLCMMYIVLEKQDVISNIKYIRMVKTARKKGVKPAYASLDEYHASLQPFSFPTYIIWIPMIAFFILTVVWM